jgi:exodeoxyribonuclease V beta subunit
VGALLTGGGGERELTDLDHIAELMAGELGGLGTTAAAARRCLDRLTGDASDADELGPQMRRIDSDADAVQITTIHSSKGLQFPIVLLPFSYTARSASTPLVYNDPSGQRVVDIASGQGWTGGTIETSVNGRKHFADVEQQGDSMRLLYVALTRAEHRSVVWWAPLPDSGRSALSRVLLERDDEGLPSNVQPELKEGARGAVKSIIPAARPAGDDDAAQRLATFAQRSDGLIEVDTCPLALATGAWHPPASRAAPPVLAVADPAGRVVSDPAWRRWSFTSITRTIEHHWDSPSVPVMGGVDEPADPDGDEQRGRLDRVVEDRVVEGRVVEDRVVEDRVVEDRVVEDRVGSATTSAVMPWADAAGGTAFGTLVHSVLERLDPAGPGLEAQLRNAVSAQLRRDRIDVPADVLEAGLHAALHTSLGPLAGGLRLVDIAATDRLAELDFDLPLVNAVGRFPAAAIGEVLLATLAADDPQRAYARSLADGRYVIDLSGYLQGSIDAVLRLQVDGQQRFVVVDYKTNRLHSRGAAAPLEAYHPDRLPEAMAEHDYPLQSLLYSVALHRYLRWRLADYQPHQHLGGIAYLFLRGMVGQHAPSAGGVPYGVFAWRPPAATIVALDRLLARGVVA